jgi:hypothetical protein
MEDWYIHMYDCGADRPFEYIAYVRESFMTAEMTTTMRIILITTKTDS